MLDAGKAQSGEDLVEFGRVRPRTGRPAGQPHRHVLGDTEILVEFDGLERSAEAGTDSAVGTLAADDADLSRCRGQSDLALAAGEATDRVHQGGLARTVGPDEPDDGAARRREPDVVYGDHAAVPYGDPGQLQHHIGIRNLVHRSQVDILTRSVPAVWVSAGAVSAARARSPMPYRLGPAGLA